MNELKRDSLGVSDWFLNRGDVSVPPRSSEMNRTNSPWGRGVAFWAHVC